MKEWLIEKESIDYLKILNLHKEQYFQWKMGFVFFFAISLVPLYLFVFKSFTVTFILLGVGLCVLGYFIPYFFIKTKATKKAREVEYDFPLWLSSLEVLIVSNNIPNTLKKSIPTCPLSFKQDLIYLVDQVEKDPTNQIFYREFLSQYHNESIREMMLDLYQFNFLNKELLVKEFNLLHQRLNEIEASQRKHQQEQTLFFIGAINSIPLFLLSMYILYIANLLSTTLIGGVE